MCSNSSVQIEETAATWLAKRDREDWSEAQQAGLTVWLDASTAHRIAFIRLEAAWQKVRRLKELDVGADAGGVPPECRWLGIVRSGRRELPPDAARTKLPEKRSRPIKE